MTPVGDQLFALVETKNDVSIADIDRQKHILDFNLPTETRRQQQSADALLGRPLQ